MTPQPAPIMELLLTAHAHGPSNNSMIAAKMVAEVPA